MKLLSIVLTNAYNEKRTFLKINFFKVISKLWQFMYGVPGYNGYGKRMAGRHYNILAEVL